MMVRPLVLVVLLVAACSSPKPTISPGGTGGSGGSGPPVEICGNHIDDDGNGKTDCADPACHDDPSCPACGDGFLDEREVCDGAELGTASCGGLGYNGGGTLRCKPDCTLDLSGCRRHEDCSTPGDEDQNGLADCADPACSGLAACLILRADPLPQEVHVGALLEVVLHAADGAGTPLGGQHVQLTGPAQVAIAPADAVLDTEGSAVFSLRMGRAPGTVHLSAQLDATQGELPLDIDVVEAAAGNIVTVVDADRIAGSDGQGPAIAAHVGTILGLAAGADGTLYLGEACRILAVAPDGLLSRLAGTGTCGTSSGDGPADHDDVTVSGIALDAKRDRLYLTGGGRVVWVDLKAPQLHLLAGGGATAPAQALGGPATAALLDPRRVAVSPAGLLAFTDTTGGVLTVDPDTGILGQLPASTAAAGDCGQLALAHGATPEVAFDGDGSVFASTLLCGLEVHAGTPSATVATPGIVRFSSSALVRVAGQVPGLAPHAAAALQAELADAGPMAFDAGGNLVFVSGDDILGIDGVTGIVSRLGGAGIPSFAGEDEPLALARFHDPRDLAFGPGGDLYVADAGNGTVRRVVGLGQGATTAVHVVAASGDAQSAFVGQALPAPLSIKVTDPQGQPYPGLAAKIDAMEPGSLVGPPVVTGSDGTAALAAVLGIVPGTATFHAGIPGIHAEAPAGASATFTATVRPPDAGMIFTATQAASGIPFPAGARVPARSASISVTRLLPASTGEVYLASYCQVFRLRTDGTVELVAGNGTCTLSTAGGQATATSFYIGDIALDEKAGLLYVAEYADVRRIDLATGVVQAFAGPGTGMDGDGDGGAALNATFGSVFHMERASDGSLYVGGTSYIRRIDPATGIVDRVLTSGACATPTTEGLYGAATALHLSGDELWVAGYVCDGGNIATGLLHRDAAGNLSHLVPGPGISATALEDGPPGTLVVGNYGVLEQVDTATGELQPLAGAAGRPSGGDYGPALDAGLGYVYDVARDRDGHLWLADYGVLRVIW